MSRDRVLASATAVIGLSLVVLPVTVHATVDEPKRLGDIVVVDAVDTNREISGGGSAVEFSFGLPVGTTCPGDSAHDDWRVHAFLIPVGDDPAAIEYGPNGPEGPGQWALYGSDSNPYIDQVLAANPSAGSPGLILPIRPLTFAVFTDEILAPGMYRMGLACTYFRDTATYWDTVVEVTEDPADEPAHRTWRVVESDAPEAGVESGSRSTTWLLIGGGLLAVAAALAWYARSASSARSASQLPSATESNIDSPPVKEPT